MKTSENITKAFDEIEAVLAKGEREPEIGAARAVRFILETVVQDLHAIAETAKA